MVLVKKPIRIIHIKTKLPVKVCLVAKYNIAGVASQLLLTGYFE